MDDRCPYLDYRASTEDGDTVFDTPRAYCRAAEEFVQPMRADICNDRFELAHDRDCEIFRDHTGCE